MEYKNESKFTQEELVDLLSKQTLPLPKMIISIGSILILLLILVLSWDKENPTLYIVMSILLGIGLIGVILLLIGKKWLIKVSNKSIVNGVIYNYTLTDKGFKVESTIGEKQTVTQAQYCNLEKIIIKEDIAHLYFNNVSIFFLKLENFTEEEKEEVIKLFEPFKIKKSKR